MDTMFEKAHLRLILILTSVINKLASIAAHICISIAFSLSPKKYCSGKFCLSCLKVLYISQLFSMLANWWIEKIDIVLHSVSKTLLKIEVFRLRVPYKACR